MIPKKRGAFSGRLGPQPGILRLSRSAPVAEAEFPARTKMSGPVINHFTTYGSSPRKRARLIALASSRCFFWLTAVMRDGTILPRSEM